MAGIKDILDQGVISVRDSHTTPFSKAYKFRPVWGTQGPTDRLLRASPTFEQRIGTQKSDISVLCQRRSHLPQVKVGSQLSTQIGPFFLDNVEPGALAPRPLTKKIHFVVSSRRLARAFDARDFTGRNGNDKEGRCWRWMREAAARRFAKSLFGHRQTTHP